MSKKKDLIIPLESEYPAVDNESHAVYLPKTAHQSKSKLRNVLLSNGQNEIRMNLKA